MIAKYNSSTLKYKIIRGDYVLIWVKDARKQLNTALASSNAKGSAAADKILSNELSKYGSNKGMVATNASFFSSQSPKGGVVISKGKIAKDSGLSAGVIGINNSGNLVLHNNESATTLLNKGILNTFVISSPTDIDNSPIKSNRTQICQIDKNNFAILSGYGTVKGCGSALIKFAGCTSRVYNLDGGGSRKLYYKTGSGNLVKRFGGDRLVPDMLYFIEQ